MGVKNLSDILDQASIPIRKKRKLSDFADKVLAMDAFNVIYQFLASIRDRTGQNMQDTEGRITSHLIGILTRNCNLLQEGILPVYVFDGESHPLKRREQERRRDRRSLAEEEYQKALKVGDLVKARSFAQQIIRLNEEMLEDSKKLLRAMGIPIVQAPGEGEAQAAILARQGKVYATASQDYDALLFGTPILVRNINISGRRTRPGGGEIIIDPEEIELESVLSGMELTREQLIDVGILIGTDFNPDGIKGIGPKTAYKYIKQYGDFRSVEKAVDKVKNAEIPYDEIRDIFLHPNVDEHITIDTSAQFDTEQILDFLVNERGFSEGRYINLLKKTERLIKDRQQQTTLDDFF